MICQTRENIEKYCEKFEKEMLNLFDRCYRKGDPKMMHVCLEPQAVISHWLSDTFTPDQHCAQTLLEFNGGASCVQVYVNQHDFFINSVREHKPADDTMLCAYLFAFPLINIQLACLQMEHATRSRCKSTEE
jgi:exocyst complex component 5